MLELFCTSNGSYYTAAAVTSTVMTVICNTRCIATLLQTNVHYSHSFWFTMVGAEDLWPTANDHFLSSFPGGIVNNVFVVVMN